jgi:protein arginine N-methyltransferase 1
MYSVFDYGSMLADRRSDLYAEALRRTVQPGAVVVDLGAGTGIWAAYACQLGARRVFAIEPDDVIGLGREMAEANGLADRVTWLQEDATRVQLDAPADVVVADVRGVLPFAGTGLVTMIDARRFLAPGGVLIPLRDSVWVSVVHAPAAHRATVQPWDERAFGADASAARRAAVNMWRKERFEADDLLSSPVMWAEIDYRTLETPSFDGRAEMTVQREAGAHGLAIWFESDLTPEVRLSNRPGDPPLIYGQGFFPWPEPVAVKPGDRVSVWLRAAFQHTEYVFGWDTRVIGDDGVERARFVQSTFDGWPLSLARVRALATDAVIVPGVESAVERFVLASFDGLRTQGEVAAAVREAFPGRFADQAAALAAVAAIGQRVLGRGGTVTFRD